ncbi:hypothetical protein GCM10010446_02010 [Streptomyces enissocaesilis]|uniref:Uncharacterized protein n=1 Tax=Streptomyces enissocaesilis TaxID=332589 RepID=A0ABN3WNR4_9ACTN
MDTNNARSGASSAQSGSETRGALKRFSQSGMDMACADPVLSVIPPFCAAPEQVHTTHQGHLLCE